MNQQTASTSYQLVIDVLGAIHVGSGGPPLSAGFDFVLTDGGLVVIDPDAALAVLGDAGARGGQLAAALDESGRESARRYQLTFTSDVAPATIRPVARTAFGAPYIPGSALKGALRTALSTMLLERERSAGNLLRKADLAPAPRFASQPVERRLFGTQPRMNVFRGVQAGDARAEDRDLVSLAAVASYGIEDGKLTPGPEREVVEVLRPGTRFAGTLQIGAPPTVRSEQSPDQTVLAELVPLAQQHATARIESERAFFESHSLGALASYYAALKNAGLQSEQSFLVQIGWGAGWESKSFGPALEASPDWPLIRDEWLLPHQRRGPERRPRFGGAPPRQRAARGPKPFPATRKLVEFGGSPALPFGWVLVTLVPAGEPLPAAPSLPVAWRDEPMITRARQVATTAAGPASAPATATEPESPFARLQALLVQQAAQPEAAEETAPRPPIAKVNDKNLRVGLVLEGEITGVEPTRILVNVGRNEPAAVEASVVGGGDLTARFAVGQRLRVRVLTPPPFFRIRLA